MSRQDNEILGDHRLGIFPSRLAAENAFNDLLNAGFDRDDLSLFVHEPAREFATKAEKPTTDAAVGAGGAAGAGFGGIAGGIGGTLAGLGLLAIPGVGTMLALGPLAAALTGAITGSAIGGFAGSLVGLGISEAEAAACEQHMKAGRAVLVVNCGARCSRAVAVMRAADALVR